MANPIVKSYQTPVVLIGGGDVAWSAYASLGKHRYPIIAVDAGVHCLAQQNITPELIIGDMDSLGSIDIQPDKSEIIEISEQETTDFEKALYSIDAPLYLAFGFWGGRLDHSLAALHIVTKYRASKKVVLVDTTDLMFSPQGPFTFSCPLEARVSIIPLQAVAFERSFGLKYPLDGLTLKTGSAIGVSNETSKPEFQIIPVPADKDNYSVIMPNETLLSVLALIS